MKMQKHDIHQCPHIPLFVCSENQQFRLDKKERDGNIGLVSRYFLPHAVGIIGEKETKLCMRFRDTGHKGCFCKDGLDLKITLAIMSIHKI